jgi:hypothetical protein
MDYSANSSATLGETLSSVVIHYEGATSVTDAGYKGGAGVYRIQAYDMSNGLYDISYHYVIDANGNIYEGRDIGVRGAHVSPEAHNTGRIGILWLGVAGSTGGPTEKQYQATVGLLYVLDMNYGISEVASHRELEEQVGSYTECPGNAAIPFVEMLKGLVSLWR